MKGRLCILEGGDGAGKSTQAARLCQALRLAGRDPLHLREPGSTDLGEAVRAILLHPDAGEQPQIAPWAEVFLYMAARAQLFQEVIGPALSRGRFVVLERSYYSTYAYQGAGLGLDRAAILSLGAIAVGGIRPDRVVLIDLDTAEAAGRLARPRDRVESRDAEYHRRVRQGFLELAGREPNLFRVVDGSGTVEEVHGRVLEALRDVL